MPCLWECDSGVATVLSCLWNPKCSLVRLHKEKVLRGTRKKRNTSLSPPLADVSVALSVTRVEEPQEVPEITDIGPHTPKFRCVVPTAHAASR